MCFLNIKACQHILLHQIQKIIFKIASYDPFNFYKVYLFGFETLVFATSGISSMQEQLVTLQRERKTWNHIIWPL